MQNLGFSINWGKVIYPCQRLIFLGIEIGTILRQLILPQRKISKIQEILQFSLSKDKLTKGELQNIIGKLNFASRVIYGGRTFLRRRIDFYNKLKNFIIGIDVIAVLKRTLIGGLISWKFSMAIQKLLIDPLCHNTFFSTDACPTWGGAQLDQDWFHSNWKADYPHFSELHINKLEVFTVYLSILRWHEQFRNKWVVIHVDNSCTLAWLNKGTAHCPLVMSLRDIFWFSALSNFKITARYISTTDNVNSDIISRLTDVNYTQTFLNLTASGDILLSDNNVSNKTFSILPLQIKSKLKKHHLDHKVSLYRSAMFSESTSRTYKSQLRACLRFCLYFGHTIIPASSLTIL